jgi:hypothetical protein
MIPLARGVQSLVNANHAKRTERNRWTNGRGSDSVGPWQDLSGAFADDDRDARTGARADSYSLVAV